MNPEFSGAFYEFCYVLIKDRKLFIIFFIALKKDSFKKTLGMSRKLLVNLTIPLRKEYQDIAFSRTQSAAKRDVNFRPIFFISFSNFISFFYCCYDDIYPLHLSI